MCGIAGIFNFNKKLQPKQKLELDKMISILQHRGPDNKSLQFDKNCGLAHQRLSIIDLSKNGNQPMSNEHKNIWLTFNGEIYNHLQLKKSFSLENNGHVFSSKTDSEIIIHLYEELGITLLNQLNGMYSFALWDSCKQKVYLARDPFGIKPLYYMIINKTLYFASEIKALLEIQAYTPKINNEALYHYLTYEYIPGQITIFDNIYELAPGHFLEMSTTQQQPKITKFYNFNFSSLTQLSEKTIIKNTQKYLEKTVQRHLTADVNVGIMLSGGLDSSSLAAIARKLKKTAKIHTFSLTFNDNSYDESQYSQLMAKKIGSIHHEINVSALAVKKNIKKQICFFDTPSADGSAIPLYLLAEQAKKHVKVLLAGEGGDEIFAGYDTYSAFYARKAYRKIPAILRQTIIKNLVNKLPVSHKKLSFDFLAKRFVNGAELDTLESHLFWRNMLTEDIKTSLLSKKYFSRHTKASYDYILKNHSSDLLQDEFNNLLNIDYTYVLPYKQLLKVDRMTMAHSIEARVPFLDKELIEFILPISQKIKMKYYNKKYILKKSMRKLLPKKIINRKKIGLNMPYSNWFRKELFTLGDELFSRKKIEALGFFNYKIINKMWQEHQEMKMDHGRALWGLANFIIWHDLYIKTKNYKQHLNPR